MRGSPIEQLGAKQANLGRCRLDDSGLAEETLGVIVVAGADRIFRLPEERLQLRRGFALQIVQQRERFR